MVEETTREEEIVFNIVTQVIPVIVFAFSNSVDMTNGATKFCEGHSPPAKPEYFSILPSCSKAEHETIQSRKIFQIGGEAGCCIPSMA